MLFTNRKQNHLILPAYELTEKQQIFSVHMDITSHLMECAQRRPLVG